MFCVVTIRVQFWLVTFQEVHYSFLLGFFFSLRSFKVDLRSEKSKDIALHLNPRLNIKAFVTNSCLRESWGEEERNTTDFPFSPGMYFEVRFFFFENGIGAGVRLVRANQAPLWRSMCGFDCFETVFRMQHRLPVQMAEPAERHSVCIGIDGRLLSY